jgi:type 1 glutamine amidotransferase
MAIKLMKYQSRTRRVILQSLAMVGLITMVLISAPRAFALVDTSSKKIVFIAGNPSHSRGEHEHRAGCMLLADQLNKSGLPVQAVVTTHGWPQDVSIFQGVAAVIIYSDGGSDHPALQHLEELKKLAKDGVGIGCIHYAVEIPVGAPGDTFCDLIGGYFETNWSVNPHWQGSFKLPMHEITRGIHDFEITDEWYYHLRFTPEMAGITPILTALPPPESLSRLDGPHEGNPAVRAAVLERKEPQSLMWAYDRPQKFGAGRAFGFTGGHFHRNWQQDDQRRLVLNAIAWISGLEIPEKGVPSETPSDAAMDANLDEK